MTTCKTWCVSDLCKRRKACACNCEAWFGGSNPTLVQSCQGKCWNSPDFYKTMTAEQYACKEIGAQDMFNRFGTICPGYDPLTGSAQGQAYTQQQADLQKSSESKKPYIWLAALFILILLAVYFWD